MKCIAFACKFGSEIRIALPIGERGPLNRSVTAGRKPAMWQRVRKDVACRLFEFGAASKIPALMRLVAPCSILGPVPRRHAEFAIVAIADRTPSRRKRFLNDVRAVNLIDSRTRQNVDRASQGAIG